MEWNTYLDIADVPEPKTAYAIVTLHHVERRDPFEHKEEDSKKLSLLAAYSASRESRPSGVTSMHCREGFRILESCVDIVIVGRM